MNIIFLLCNPNYHSLCSWLSLCCLGLCRLSCLLRDGQDQSTRVALSPDSAPHSPDWSCVWWPAAGFDHDHRDDHPFGQNGRCHDQTVRSGHCALDSSCFWRRTETGAESGKDNWRVITMHLPLGQVWRMPVMCPVLTFEELVCLNPEKRMKAAEEPRTCSEYWWLDGFLPLSLMMKIHRFSFEVLYCILFNLHKF